jgi:hypothetical protein
MSLAIVHWISGPVLHATKQGPFALREAVRVGPQALLGEVVRIEGELIVVQVYEDTAGLRPGTQVQGSGDDAKDKAARQSCVRQWFAWYHSNKGNLLKNKEEQENLLVKVVVWRCVLVVVLIAVVV